MVKLVDMPDLGSGAARRVGSSPIIRTLKTYKSFIINVLWVFLFLELAQPFHVFYLNFGLLFSSMSLSQLKSHI
jgi:hypothetical protein